MTIFSHMTRYVSVFVIRDTIFRFFCKLPYIETSNFCKVVRQHTKGMTRSIIWFLLEINWKLTSFFSSGSLKVILNGTIR